MTPLQQRGYNDKKSGQLDPDLSRHDGPDGREYRQGMRMAQWEADDKKDGILSPVKIQIATPNAFVDPPTKRKKTKPASPTDQLSFL